MKNLIKLILLAVVVFFVIYFFFPNLASTTLGLNVDQVSSSNVDSIETLKESNESSLFEDGSKSIEEALSSAKAKFSKMGEVSPEFSEDMKAQIEKLNELPDFFIDLVAKNVSDEQISSISEQINLEDAKEMLANIDQDKIKTIVDSIGLDKIKDLLTPEQFELLNDKL